MWKWLVLMLGLAVGPANAADRGTSSTSGDQSSNPVEAPLTASGPFGGRGPIETLEDDMKEKKSEKELAAQARLAQVEAATKGRAARVVVIKWPDSDADYKNENIQRNIKTRIARSDAKFYPEIDLYQNGRREPDREIRPADQRAMVPEDASDRIMAEVDEISAVPWNALTEQEWRLRAYSMRELAKEMWFIDRPELREPLFLLYSQIGRAADASGDGSPPFYEQVGDRTVNYYWYLAGAMAHETPELMSKLTEKDLNASIGYFKDMLDRGDFPPMTLSFEVEGSAFDAKSFASEYQLFINGIEEVIDDPNGLYLASPGRVDVYFARDDGHSLSDRIELDKLNDKIYFVRDVARKRMGLDFKDQLMEHPYECIPPIDGDILTYLSIYQKLHPQAEVYIALAVGGSIAPNKILLWRWDPTSALLMKVQNDNSFPIRFAITAGTGMIFNGASYTAPPITKGVDAGTTETASLPTGGGTGGAGSTATQAQDAAKEALTPEVNPKPSGVPIMYHLRGHYNRLMFQFGLEYAQNITPAGEGENPPEGGPKWADKYQTNHKVGNEDHELLDADGNVILRERKLQRLVHFGVGFMLGKNAAIGFGPRAYFRTGWYNAPHAVDLTVHAGYAAIAPWAKDKGEEIKDRVNPLIDFDLFGGILLPFRDSLFITGENKFCKGAEKCTPKASDVLTQKLGKSIGTFGMTLEAGTTF